MKRLVSLFLCLILAVALLPLAAKAETYGNWEYTVVEPGKIEIKKYNGTETDVTLSAYLNGFNVIGIANGAFSGRTSIVNLTLPSSVTSIGKMAFSSCTSLAGITVPAGVSVLGEGAFQGCSSLTYVTILGNIATIEDYTFYGCTQLKNVSFPASVTHIKGHAFYGCSSLEYVSFGGSAAGITIDDGNDPLVIATKAYSSGKILASGGCGASGGNVTWKLDDAGKLTISGKGAMKDYPYYVDAPWTWNNYYDQIESIVIGAGVTHIGSKAFWDCMDVFDVTIPLSVTSIGNDAFYNCLNLRHVYYSGVLEDWLKINYSSADDPLSYAEVHFCVPELQSAGIVNGVVQVNWKAVSGASKYVVFRKAGSGNWVQIGSATGTSYLDKTVANGITYSYTVRAMVNAVLSGYDPDGVSIKYFAPVLQGASIVNGVVQVKWKAVSGASKYVVFRKKGSGNWVQIGSATGASYLDNNVVNGNTYSYTVRAMVGGALSGYDTVGTSIKYIAPELQSTSIVNGVVQVKWKAVSGATKYYVFRKTGSGNWVQIGSATGASYLDKTVANGNTYTYTVRAMVDGKLSGYDTAGISIQYIAPELQGVSIVNGVLQVKWKTVPGATKYYVFRKASSGIGIDDSLNWVQIGTSASNTYIDKNLAIGEDTTYVYTVRALVGGKLSGYNTNGTSIYYFAPTVSATVVGGNVQVGWDSPLYGSAPYYIVFRKVDGSAWSQVAKAYSNSYTDNWATAGHTYTYTVRAYIDGELNGYDTVGASVTR